ncbi:MAG: UUP1 family membrane protein [Rhodospirillales bacterium]
MRNRSVYLLAALLAAAGLALFAYKVVALEFPLSPDDAPDNWEVEARVTFTAVDGPATVRLFVPRSTRNHTVLDQSFISRGYALSTDVTPEGRMARLTRRQAKGPQSVYFRFLIHRTEPVTTPAVAEPEPVQPPPWKGLRLEAGRAMLDQVRVEAESPLVIADAVLKRLARSEPDDVAKTLLGNSNGAERRVTAAAAVLRLGGMNARAVHGIALEVGQKPVRFVHWMEVAEGGVWHRMTADPAAPEVPATWFPWWRGTAKLAQVDGGGTPKVRITVERAADRSIVDTLGAANTQSKNLLTSAMTSLPLEVQQVYRVLLVVPLGVLLLVVLRNVIGLKSFGTFMPVLIALAFRETQLLWGIILFTVIVAIGLAIRLWMERLRLLVVPRLAAVLIIVVGAMAGLSVLSAQLGLAGGLSVALFPMVILTMTVERMSVIWDERGPRDAMQQGVGSLIVATACYLLISYPMTEHLFFQFPELLMVVLAAVLLLGRYSGYRLTELYRFKPLSGGGT